MEKRRIQKLYQKYLQNTCTREELKLLFKYLEDPQWEKDFQAWDKKMGRGADASNLMRRHSDQYKDRLLDEVMARTQDPQSKAAPPEDRPALANQDSHRGVVDKGRQRKNFAVLYKVAAVLVLAVLASLPIYYMWQQANSAEEAQPLVYTTKERQRTTITLADGSTVRLNANSTLTCSPEFAGGVREVLLQGEAFFTVTEDANKPFLVKTAHLATRVLGTSFNVKAFPEQPIAVTVATGEVRVSPLEGGSKEVPDRSQPAYTGSAMVLTQAEQAIYNPRTGSMEKKEVDPERFVGWKDGTLVFEQNNFTEVAEILEQWYGVEVKVENPKLDNCSVSGKFMEHPTLHKVLKGLQFIYKIEYEFMGEKVLITGNGCD